ncbi:MAG: hypothetical protein MI920_00795 [Kiloniellales bacterium]|nr:hypothetical protein [Kiloniellales bacterium]
MARPKAARPDCAFADLTPTGVTCPQCGAGKLVPARGRFGPVYRCDAPTRPKCGFRLDSRPTGEVCTFERDGKACGALIVEGTKTIPARCSDRDCPNRHPHKLARGAG